MDTETASAPAGARDQRGDAPVDQVHLAERSDHHVLGLDVAVDDAAAVRVRDRVADVQEDVQHPVEGVAVVGQARRVPQHIEQRLPANQPHREARAAADHRQLVNRDDVRVLELGGDLGLLEEVALRPRAARQVGPPASSSRPGAAGWDRTSASRSRSHPCRSRLRPPATRQPTALASARPCGGATAVALAARSACCSSWRARRWRRAGGCRWPRRSRSCGPSWGGCALDRDGPGRRRLQRRRQRFGRQRLRPGRRLQHGRQRLGARRLVHRIGRRPDRRRRRARASAPAAAGPPAARRAGCPGWSCAPPARRPRRCPRRASAAPRPRPAGR